MRTIGILLILFITINLSLNSQLLDPVKWTYSVEKISEKEYNLVYKAKIDEGWHLYSQFVKDGGPLPTAFEYANTNGFELVGKASEIPAPKSSWEEAFQMDVLYFDKKETFKQKIKISSDKSLIVSGEISYMVCNDETCVPLYKDFSFNIVPVAETNEVENNVIVDTSVSENNVDSNLTLIEDTVSVTNNSNQTIISETDFQDDGRSIWSVILEAILWGFAALITPCVFPMIPMTVSFFMKGSENKARGRFQASVYGISIVALYTIPIAVIILITYFVGGKTVTADIFNWLSTHWIPNILFFIIFVLFAFSFLGMFEIVIPSRLVNKSDSKADKGGVLGAFFMALTLVLVSFSCTGPLVGSVLVKSAQGEIFEPIFAMLAFSIAFAIPFTLFAFFPGWLHKLPKSGGWLNSVKVILGFIELALGLKFLSIADQTYHWGILDREVYLALWIVIFTLMGLYLLGKLKFAHDSDMKYIKVPRLMLAVASFAFVVYMIPGMFGAPLKLLSGYMPPQQTLDFDLQRIIRENAESADDGLCVKPKYSDFLHLPHSLKGYFDYEQALVCAKEKNKPIFIDFTGHGCVNCREMEANVWSDVRVLKKLREEFIVVALYVDDKTTMDESEWIVSKYDGKLKKSIGKKYADFQISNFNMNAQPYYVLLDNKGDINDPDHIKINLLAKPKAYDLDVDNFIKFLDDGLAEFKKRKK
ncbi:MAG: cytochrome c biogenesis protein CcdA [Bacteroidota bacterium]